LCLGTVTFKLFLIKVNLHALKNLLLIIPNCKYLIKGFFIKLETNKKFGLMYLNILKNTSSLLFEFLLDIVIVDYPWKQNRLTITYILRSVKFNRLMFVNLILKDYNKIYSINNIYKSSLWLERESWDFFGVFFLHNKNLKRILTDYGFKGNPLKKDFPLIGYKELFMNMLSSVLSYKKLNFG